MPRSGHAAVLLDPTHVMVLGGYGRNGLAASNYESNTLSVLVNTGLRTFAPRLDYATGLMPTHLLALDFDGDARLDLVANNEEGHSFSVLFNTCH